MKIKIIQKFNKQIKFLVVGGMATFTDLIVLMLCNHILHIELNLSITFAYTASALVHFSCNRQAVFKNSTISIKKSCVRYIMLLFVNYITNVAILNICVNKFNFYLLAAKILATGIGMIISYLMLNFFVFKGNHSERKNDK